MDHHAYPFMSSFPIVFPSTFIRYMCVKDYLSIDACGLTYPDFLRKLPRWHAI